MIKDLKKVNSEALLKAEASAFTKLQEYTIKCSQGNHDCADCSMYRDKGYMDLRAEWTRLLAACGHRGLTLLKVDVK